MSSAHSSTQSSQSSSSPAEDRIAEIDDAVDATGTSSSFGDHVDDAVPAFEPVRQGDYEELTKLAQTLSQSSRRPSIGRSITVDSLAWNDPALDPSSSSFVPYKWARTVIKRLDDQGIRRDRVGVVFKNLSVSGTGSALQLQETVGSSFLVPFRPGSYARLARSAPKRHILHSFDGLLRKGEMLMVLGRPGSGCSTFLKTLCGELHGLDLHGDSVINYNGIPMEKMHRELKGECVYNQEVDKHFPHLTVGQTLEFAAAARAPHARPDGITRGQYVSRVTQVMMAILGLSHTYNTKGQSSLAFVFTYPKWMAMAQGGQGS